MRKVNAIPRILNDLRTGYGAVRLPGVVRSVELHGVSSGRTGKQLRRLIHEVLPRIKYNNTSLDIKVLWKDVDKAKSDKSADVVVVAADAAQPSSSSGKHVRLTFDGLPDEQISLNGQGKMTTEEITRQIFHRISTVSGEKIDQSYLNSLASEEAAARSDDTQREKEHEDVRTHGEAISKDGGNVSMEGTKII